MKIIENEEQGMPIFRDFPFYKVQLEGQEFMVIVYGLAGNSDHKNM